MAGYTHLNLDEIRTLVACVFSIEPEQLHSFVLMADYGCEHDGKPEHCHAVVTTNLERQDNEDRVDLLTYGLKYTNYVEHGRFDHR